MIAEIIDWSVALVPVLAMLALFVWLDVFKLMTLWETLSLLLLGGLAALLSYPVSGVFLDALPIGFSSYSRFVAPWIEEAIKGAAIVALFAFNRIGFKLDAVISGFAVGAGFSVVENLIYLWRFPELDAGVWLVRGLGTAVMHGTTLAILAAMAHELAERETREAASSYRFNPLWFAPGYLAAAALHMTFNQFPDQPLLAMAGTMALAPLALLAILRSGAKEAGDWLIVERDQHRGALDCCGRAAFPTIRAGAGSPRSPPAATRRRPSASANIARSRPGSSSRPKRRLPSSRRWPTAARPSMPTRRSSGSPRSSEASGGARSPR